MLSHALLAVPLVFAQWVNPNETVSRAGRVGISLSRAGNVLVIDGVEKGTSAEAVGLKIGDQVLRIDLDTAEGMSPTEASAVLRGLLGSKTMLTVLPRASMFPKKIEVERDVRVYLAHDKSSPLQPGELNEAIRSVLPSGGGSGDDIVEASFAGATSGGQPLSAELANAFAKSGADVATCIGALRDVLPEGFPSEFAATMTVKKDTISVRTEPASGDLASCLGRKAAGWGLPVPKKKDPPIELKATWTWTRGGVAVPAATTVPVPEP